MALFRRWGFLSIAVVILVLVIGLVFSDQRNSDRLNTIGVREILVAKCVQSGGTFENVCRCPSGYALSDQAQCLDSTGKPGVKATEIKAD